jgi:hypothetical protein
MLIRRIAAGVLAAGVLVMSSGHATADAEFENLGGFTVTPISPDDVLVTGRPVAGRFHELGAAEVGEDGSPIMRVLVGQLNSGSGEDFVHSYLSELSAIGEKLDPPKVVASGPPQDVGGYPARYYHMYMSAEGYAYTDGPTVVIAEIISGGPIDRVQDAFVKILNNVYQR